MAICASPSDWPRVISRSVSSVIARSAGRSAQREAMVTAAAACGQLAGVRAMPCDGFVLTREMRVRAQHLDEEGAKRAVPPDADAGAGFDTGKLVAAHGDPFRVSAARSTRRARARVRVEAKNAWNIGFAAGEAFFQPEDVERGVGEIAGEQIVEHRGLARGLFVERGPVQRIEETVASIGVARDAGSVGLDAGDGEMDIHGRCSFRHHR
jgi:hypothetical protein